MLLRSGADTEDCIMPDNKVSWADHIMFDEKPVLIDGQLRSKRTVGLRTFYETNEKERRETLLSLFKAGRTDTVQQIHS